MFLIKLKENFNLIYLLPK